MRPITLVRLRIFIYTFVALAVAWQTTMTDVVWDNLGWVQKSCLFAGILSLWGNTMLAYFDKSLWKYDESKKTNEKIILSSAPAGDSGVR